MKCLVTGAAGFIGSHLAGRLLKDGFEVVGIDCFTNYYPRQVKERNISSIIDHKMFELIEYDLLNIDLNKVLPGINYVFHQAAQPGVRASWGENFQVYVNNNVLATQRILEACKNLSIKKFIFASSSSVYGNSPEYPILETTATRPISPYGVTKLSAECLCNLYHVNFGVPAVMLRYFTVYGPRQRPDMAFSRFISSICRGSQIDVYGDGEQTRDCTYVEDIVEANINAMNLDVEGMILNIGSGKATCINNIIRTLAEISGKELELNYLEGQKGDAKHTLACIDSAKQYLNYSPAISLKNGLREQYNWYLENKRYL